MPAIDISTDQPRTLPYAQPFSVRAQSVLVQDHVGSRDLLLPTYGPQQAALYANPVTGEPEGAVIVNGSLQRLVHDVLSPGGYALVPYPPVSGNCQQVVAARTLDGKVFVAVATSTDFACFEITGDGPVQQWSEGAPAVNLQVSYTQGANPDPRLTFALTSQGTGLNVLAYAQGQWTPMAGSPFTYAGVDFRGQNPAYSGYSLYSAAWTGGGTLLNVAVIQQNSLGEPAGTVYQNSGSGTQATSLGNTGLYQVLGPVYEQDMVDWLVIDLGGHLTLSRGGTCTWIGGGIVVQNGVVVPDTSGLVHLYLTTYEGDSNGTDLSVVHQSGFDADGPTWVTAINESAPRGEDGATVSLYPAVAVPIRQQVAQVQADPYPVDMPTLVIATADVSQARKEADNGPWAVPPVPRLSVMPIRLLTQSTSDGRWMLDPLRLGSRTVYNLPRWRTEAALFDANGTPVPQYPVTVSAADTCLVEVEGQFLLLGPGVTSALSSGPAGRFTFASAADGLTAPSLLIGAAGLAGPVAVRPDQPVQDYLAGTGSLPNLPPLTGSTLQAAAVNGHPLVPATTWSSDLTPATALGNMRSIIALAPGTTKAQVPAALGSNRAGFRLVRTQPGGPVLYQEFLTSEELRAQVAATAFLPGYAGSLAGWWDVITEFAGDVWEGIKSGVAEVASFAVDLAGKAVHIALTIGGAIIDLGKFAIQTVKDAFDAVTGYFRALGSMISDLVDWLKDLFNFADIWNTKKAIDAALRALPDFAGNLIGQWQTSIDASVFTWLKDQAASTFDSLATQYSNTAIGQMQTIAPVPPQITTAQSDPKANWMVTHFMTYATATAAPPPDLAALPSLAAGAGPLDDLLGAFQNLDAGLVEAASGFENWIAATFTGSDTLRNVAMGQLVTALKDFAIAGTDMAEGLFDALVAALQAGLEGAKDLFDTALPFGPLNDVYRWVQQLAGISEPEDLTMAGLVSLLCAVPSTVLWKLAYGQDAKLFPNGIVPGDLAGAAGDANLTNNMCVMSSAMVYLITMIFDITNDATDNWYVAMVMPLLLLINQIFTWPSNPILPFSSPSNSNAGEKAAIARWAWYFVPAVVDFLFLVSTRIGNRSLPRWWDPVGKILDSFLGIIGLIVGCFESGFGGQNAKQWASNILLPLPPIAQLLRLDAIEEEFPEAYPFFVIGKMLINVAGDLGGGAMRSGWLKEAGLTAG
jgi:hypothetical protein